MDSILYSTLALIQKALWENGSATISFNNVEGVYAILKEHAIVILPAKLLGDITMPESLRTEWKKQILQKLYYYQNIVLAQTEILTALANEGIPVVVLKGTSASQYYPNPEYRTMGDIDLLVKQKDFYLAERTILSCGYSTTESDHNIDRHITLSKGFIQIELHWRYASENIIENPEEFDKMLFDDIQFGQTVLSDPINGLVLLEHIAQHLNNGIGFRQIIDWMMYVNKCLDDKMWDEKFIFLAENTGLEKLAIYVTRMCQLFLGLKEENITWCKCAEEDTCKNLLNYIANCGNFGHSRSSWESGEITKLPSPLHPILFFRYLQNRGQRSWILSQKHPVLKPFAWCYQSFKYIKMAKEQKKNGITVKTVYDEGDSRRCLFQKVGISIKNDS